MPHRVVVELELPGDLARLQLPQGVNRRLHRLLDKRDRDGKLSPTEQQEAEGLVELVDLLSLLKLRAERSASP
jgi:hypothetical protein